MQLERIYSKQGGGRKDDRPAPAYTFLLGYAFSDTLTESPCV
jgi:hypothetical protein